MASFNSGYKSEFTQAEAGAACAVRDEILFALAEQLAKGEAADDAATLALVERYRYEFIDQYLYRSNPTILLGLSSVMAADPRNRAAYERYGEGLADFLAAAFRAYYDSLQA